MTTRNRTAPKAQSRSKAAGEDHPVVVDAALQAEVDRAGTTTRADSAAILKAVEEQRCPLINVVSVVRCLKFSEEAGELGGALELIEQELERVLEALEGPSLERAAAFVTSTEGEPS